MRNAKFIGYSLLLASVLAMPAWAQEVDTTAAEKPAEAVVEQLSKSGTFTLDDMSKAQDTVARLNYLLEIEKKLSEIEGARRTREGGGFGGFAGGFTGMLPMPGGPMSGESLKDSGGSGYTVARIFGANGTYSAVLTNDSGKTLIAKPGDILPNGTKVKGVTMSGVRVSDTYGEFNLPFTEASSGPVTGLGVTVPPTMAPSSGS